MLSLKNRLPSQEVAGPPSSANEISLIAVNKNLSRGWVAREEWTAASKRISSRIRDDDYIPRGRSWQLHLLGYDIMGGAKRAYDVHHLVPISSSAKNKNREVSASRLE